MRTKREPLGRQEEGVPSVPISPAYVARHPAGRPHPPRSRRLSLWATRGRTRRRGVSSDALGAEADSWQRRTARGAGPERRLGLSRADARPPGRLWTSDPRRKPSPPSFESRSCRGCERAAGTGAQTIARHLRLREPTVPRLSVRPSWLYARSWQLGFHRAGAG